MKLISLLYVIYIIIFYLPLLAESISHSSWFFQLGMSSLWVAFLLNISWFIPKVRILTYQALGKRLSLCCITISIIFFVWGSVLII